METVRESESRWSHSPEGSSCYPGLSVLCFKACGAGNVVILTGS